jgi:hypothetical protein
MTTKKQLEKILQVILHTENESIQNYERGDSKMAARERNRKHAS